MLLVKCFQYIGLAAVALAFSASATMAIEAAARSAVNVRTGPGTAFNVVDQLYAGEIVDVVECNATQTWCRIFHEGPDGWVSRRFLGAPFGAGTTARQPQFGITIPLPGGGSITFGTPGYTLPPAPVPVARRVCVYDRPNYRGASICVNAGRRDANVTGFWNNRVTSLRVFGGARIRLCQNPGFGGFCNVFKTNRARLGRPLNNRASSYRTW